MSFSLFEKCPLCGAGGDHEIDCMPQLKKLTRKLGLEERKAKSTLVESYPLAIRSSCLESIQKLQDPEGRFFYVQVTIAALTVATAGGDIGIHKEVREIHAKKFLKLKKKASG
jgi:hypothetical protein